MAATSTQPATATMRFLEQSHSITYVAMTSTLYTLLCIAVIAVLTVIFVLLAYCYWFRVHRRIKYYPKTFRYSPLSHKDSDLSEDEKTPKKKPPPVGLGYEAVPRYSAAHTWPVTPVTPHADISAGHLLLTYIENNLRNKDKLNKEWDGLQASVPEAGSIVVASQPENRSQNRYNDALPSDNSRVTLEEGESDYINASFIVDSYPSQSKSTYIATQGPLQNTVGDFWQMVWENDVAVIVMLTTIIDMALPQSAQYWPTSGVIKYKNYEVRLVSEHPHSEHYIVRSVYLQNTRTGKSRTVTHFQYLKWSSVAAPRRPTPLLEFRRKVNKAHEPWQQTPLLVHCSGGVGRTGTYILIDMALSRIQKGAKELNLAATVEHLRDYRPNMVRTKAQFEFALAALVEETHAMLNAASQQQRPQALQTS